MEWAGTIRRTEKGTLIRVPSVFHPWLLSVVIFRCASQKMLYLQSMAGIMVIQTP